MRLLLVIMLLILPYSAFAQQDECDYKVEVVVNATEFEKDDFVWRMKATKIEGKSTNITGTARIDANGETVKSYKPWTSEPISRQKTSSVYSPNLKSGAYSIIAEIVVECYDANNDDNIDIKTVIINEGTIEKTEYQTIYGQSKINEEYNETADSSESTTEIGYRTKNSLDVSNKSINNETTKSLPSINNSNLQETDNKISAQTTKDVEVEGFGNIINLTNKTQDTQIDADIPEIAFVSSNEKSKELIIIFLLVISILVNIVLIWKR